jgi:tetrapyrrole methylase family protein / MazG family protein
MPRTPRRPRHLHEIDRLRGVVARLRGPGGCPWDRKQTVRSVRPFILEEAHEVVEAIDDGDPAHLREELGDVLFHVLLLARMNEERGRFTLADVAAGIADKLVRRHPHVFGTARAKTAGDVVRSWEEIKDRERGARRAIGGGIPRAVPALTRAATIGGRAARAGFDWPDTAGVVAKIAEETRELRAEIASWDRMAAPARRRARARAAHELGDMLFVLTNLARHLGVDPERALNDCLDRFCARYEAMRGEVEGRGGRIDATSLGELDRAWERAKRALERGGGSGGNPTSSKNTRNRPGKKSTGK